MTADLDQASHGGRAGDRAARLRARGTLGACGSAHFLHDGFSDVLYVLLPIWAEAFGLSHAQVGALKSLYSAALAAFQLPAGFLAERWGARAPLVAGTLLAALAYLLFGVAAGFASLALFLLLAGLGSGTQHPLSSSMIATAFREGRRRAALGAYNFTGDLGKVAFPLLVASAAAAVGWRQASLAMGALGVAAGIALYLALRHFGAGAAEPPGPGAAGAAKARGWMITDRRGFALLSAVAMVDSAVRTGFLTFLPFLLIGKGAALETVGLALALTFGGGAFGKLACGILAERLGIIRSVLATEFLTGAGIIALLFLPLAGALTLLPLVGLALNGTSSVLYGTVPEFVDHQRQSRAFGLFYTLGLGAGSLAPVLCGLLSDWAGVSATLATVGALAFATLPLCRLLAPSLSAPGVR